MNIGKEVGDYLAGSVSRLVLYGSYNLLQGAVKSSVIGVIWEAVRDSVDN